MTRDILDSSGPLTQTVDTGPHKQISAAPPQAMAPAMERVVRLFTTRAYIVLVTILISCVFCVATVAAEVITATTADGRSVRLYEDNTWEFAASIDETTEEEAEPGLVLTIENKREMPHGCRFGLRLSNNSQYRLGTIVPQVSVYKSGDVRFDSRVVGFQGIKPTESQYKDVEFSGITCDEIAALRVLSADHCNIGELNEYSQIEGACLAQLQLVPSDIISWSK